MEREDDAKVLLNFGHLKLVQAQLTAATARAEKAEALYAKAWAECHAWRTWNVSITARADHDAARREAGL